MYHPSAYCTLLYARTAFSFLRGTFPQVSSSSSTLSLLFGKRSFSSGLVISGLSAAEGGNTTDTQSSSSVNIAIGPSHRSSSRATQVGNKSTGRHAKSLSLYMQRCLKAEGWMTTDTTLISAPCQEIVGHVTLVKPQLVVQCLYRLNKTRYNMSVCQSSGIPLLLVFMLS